MNESYYRYWGKAGDGDRYHLLAYHSLDVAAVAWAFLHSSNSWLEELAALSACHPKALQLTLPHLMALHDLGKFSEPFQAQRADIARKLQGERPLSSSRFRHDSLGWALWRTWTSERDAHGLERGLVDGSVYFHGQGKSIPKEESRRLLDCWMAAMTGHHGRPPDPAARDDVWYAFGETSEAKLGQARLDARRFLFDLGDVFGLHDVELALEDPEARLAAFERSSWWVAGFAILCDWLGSNTEYFPYVDDPMPLAAYFEGAKDKAWNAMRASGLMRVVPRQAGRKDLFPSISTPTPLQEAVEQIDLGAGPQLFVLEDLTGSGKTEAAVILAARLLAAGRSDGLFFALPTMATANAMDGRLKNLVHLLFEPKASYLLSHSGPRLTLTDRLQLGDANPSSSENYGREEETTATHTASAWLADNRKKALLATMGVGTIDQALLGALQSKHAALRLFGLHSHVLIVDEVHACDPYMLEILCALIRMHSGLGGSAILLSATLPIAQKQKLAKAFAAGLKVGMPKLPASTSYPLLGVAGRDRMLEIPVTPREGSSRDLPVVFHHSVEDVVARLSAVADDGRCACWIRNSVADALEAYDLLVAKLGREQVTLFHARFALGDRLSIEDRILESFGPKSADEQRRGRVVIATQVVEQSLDLDFDVLVTDLCPIDRIIQRAGRLQRHHRETSREPPSIEVHSPVYVDAPEAGWLAEPFLRTSYVYPDPAVLWRTAGELVRRGRLSLPGEARALVEAVFDASAPVPEGLLRRSLNAEGKDRSSRSVAKMATVDLDQGYVRSGADWASDIRTPTRLGQPTTTLRLARADEAVPWFKDVPFRLQWPLSQLSVRRSQICAPSPEDETVRKRLEERQPFVGDDIVTLLLRPAGEGRWVGPAMGPGKRDGLRPVRVVYSSSRGLELIKEG